MRQGPKSGFRGIQGAIGGNHLLALFGFLAAALAYPLMAEIDPWHGHVVVGSSNRADQLFALLDHRHAHTGERLDSSERSTGEPIVLSMVERAMLDTLGGLASESALVPAAVFPMIVLFLSLPLIWISPQEISIARLSPPYPPPRSAL